MKLLTYCNKLDRELPYLLKSIEGKVPYECHIVSGEFSWSKIVFWQLKMASRYPKEKLIFVDAYDTLFVGKPDELEHITKDVDLLFCASKKCWPDDSKRTLYPTSYSRWRYLNGSVMIGIGESIRDALIWGITNKPIEPPICDGRLIYHQDNDQRFWTDVFLNGYGKLDEYCEVFQNLAAIDDSEIGMVSGRFRNLVTGKSPQFIHAAARTWNLIPKELYEDC